MLKKWENTSHAYQLRYSARRAVRLRDGKTAIDLIFRALKTDFSILFGEPRRTLLTLFAASLLRVLP